MAAEKTRCRCCGQLPMLTLDGAGRCEDCSPYWFSTRREVRADLRRLRQEDRDALGAWATKGRRN